MQSPDFTLRPFYPAPSESFRATADELVKDASRLRGVLHPVTRREIGHLLRMMNSYYSNLIEGHHTYPREIEEALQDHYSTDPSKRDLQKEAVAHMETEEEVREEVNRDPEINPASQDFLRWIHERFFQRLPEEMRVIKSKTGEEYPVIPGEYRYSDVTIGLHAPIKAEDVPVLMRSLERSYSLDGLFHPENLASVFSAHHRLAWIHPFQDGNGRVARIMTQAHLHRLGLIGEGLWSLARGLARTNPSYRTRLAAADAVKHDMMDGRGHLSERGLLQFCEYMAETAFDQVEFMANVLDLENLTKRIRRFVDMDIGMREEGFYLLREAAITGEFSRGEAPRITGLKERAARELLKHLLDRKLLKSNSPKGPVRLGLPTEAAEIYFPRLFHQG